ncbi:MAG: hypothetical protein ACR2FO_02640 [Actinomycetota bacterium]
MKIFDLVLGAALGTGGSIGATWYFAKRQVRREAQIRLLLNIMPKLDPSKTNEAERVDGHSEPGVMDDLRSNAFLAGKQADRLADAFETALVKLKERNADTLEFAELDQESGELVVPAAYNDPYHEALAVARKAFCSLKAHLKSKVLR